MPRYSSASRFSELGKRSGPGRGQEEEEKDGEEECGSGGRKHQKGRERGRQNTRGFFLKLERKDIREDALGFRKRRVTGGSEEEERAP